MRKIIFVLLAAVSILTTSCKFGGEKQESTDLPIDSTSVQKVECDSCDVDCDTIQSSAEE